MFIFVFDGYSGQLRLFQGNQAHACEATEEYQERTAKDGLPDVIYFFGDITEVVSFIIDNP
jgi:hypothetical protein